MRTYVANRPAMGALLALASLACSSETSPKPGDVAEAVFDIFPDLATPDLPPATDLKETTSEDASDLASDQQQAFDPDQFPFPFLDPMPPWEDEMLAKLTLRQKIGQHIMVRLERDGSGPAQSTILRIENYSLGGGFLSPITGIAVHEPQTTAKFINAMQTLAVQQHSVPMWIALDQEGGVYASVNGMTGGTDSVPPAALGMSGDPWVAFEQFDLMAKEIKAMGFNMNLAPSLDTHTQPANGNINTRSFGPNPQLNAELGVAAVVAMQKNLVLPTVKHFPGDGMTVGNTHHEFVVNEMSRDELDKTLLVPFKAAFEAGAAGVMTMPARFAALDDKRPAITSWAVTTGLLRQEWGFQGLVVTDDLGMEGALIGLEPGQIPGLEALKAGADVLLYVDVTDQALDELFAAIEQALASGELDQQLFDESTRRILRTKRQFGLFEKPTFPDPTDVARIPQEVATQANREAALGIARKCAVAWDDKGTPVTREDAQWPLPKENLLCIGPSPILADPASGWSWLLENGFCEMLKTSVPSASMLQFLIPTKPEILYKQIEPLLANADTVVVATFQASFSPEQEAMLNWLTQNIGQRRLIHVIQGVPFDYLTAAYGPDATLFLTGALPLTSAAGVDILLGTGEPGGTMTYDLK